MKTKTPIARSSASPVISPAIACGDGVKACGAPVLILHPLDADAFGGAAIVNDAAVPLDTFPSGTDISYESFDQFAVLSLGPNQTTTGASQVPVCNTGDVDLVGVTVTFYKGTASEQTLPNTTPTAAENRPDTMMMNRMFTPGKAAVSLKHA